MTEEKIQQSAESIAPKKKKVSMKRIAILFVVLVVGYFGLRHFEIKQAQKLNAKSEVSKFDNIESEIFDLAEEYKNGGGHDPQNLNDIALSEIQEKGAEFIYKMLLKNQQQINDLKEQTQALKVEFVKYKNQEKLGKMVFAYIDFRQRLYGGVAFEDSLKNFEMLATFDKGLQEKISKMHTPLKSFVSAKKINKDFADLIPEIIATKNGKGDKGIIAKVRHNIAKLVVIRRIDGKNPDDVDGILARTEKALHDENYQEALETLLMLDQNYHEILVNFLSELSANAEVKKIDFEILSHLKNLS